MSSMEHAFEKVEGTANDFVLIEVEASVDLSAEWVGRLCDRHRGIGGDGVLLVSPHPTDPLRARMIVRNADGSRPEMCGNGARCAALYLARKRAPERRRTTVTLDTDAGIRVCEVELPADSSTAEGAVTIDMGRLRILGEVSVDFEGRSYPLLSVDAGNPHAITFEPIDEPTFDRLGAWLQGQRSGNPWSRGVNLERVTVRETAGGSPVLDVIVFERGVGRTLACGTGACAVAQAAVFRGLSSAGVGTVVQLPGGPLTITVQSDGQVRMRGPARRVFQGTIQLPAGAFVRGG